MNEDVPDKGNLLERKINALLDFVLESAKDIATTSDLPMFPDKEYATNVTTKIQDGDENFNGWLPLQMNGNRAYSFSLQQLRFVREQSRISGATNEIHKNVQRHYLNHIVGDGLIYDVLPKDMGVDPVKLAEQMTGDKDILTIKENWEKFCDFNDWDGRTPHIIVKAMRDGECFLRLYNTAEVPTLRFIDPLHIDPGNIRAKGDIYTDTYAGYYGVKTKVNDVESIIGYYYNPDLDQDTSGNKPTLIKADAVVHIKRNVDYETPRGVPDFWCILDNLRRIDKVTQNTSALVQIQSAIAMVRKHLNQTQAKVQSLVRSNSDIRTRSIDPDTGRDKNTRKFSSGTILDSNGQTEYEFPASKIKTDNFIAAAVADIERVAAVFVLPAEWLLAKEPTDPLSPGSPVIANFRTERKFFYSAFTDLFWRVQKRMGVPDEVKAKYDLYITGPKLAVGKAIDEARVVQILQACGAMSPQTISAIFGNLYAIERANTIKHIDTLQEGEVPPGTVGATNPKNNGTDTKDGKGTKGDNAPGGNNKQ